MALPRLLWLSHMIPYPPRAGVIMRSYNLLRIAARHFDTDLFCLNQSKFLSALMPDTDYPEQVAVDILSKLVSRIHVEGIPAEIGRFGKHRVALWSLFSARPYSVNWLQSKGSRRALEKFTAGERYDLLHVDTEGLIPYLDCIDKPPVISLNHHNAEAHMMRRRAANAANVLMRAYFQYEARKLEQYGRREFPRFDLHLACSDEDRKRLHELCSQLSIEVVPNSVHVPPWDSIAEKDCSRSLLFVGGLDWYPNSAAAEFLVRDVWPMVSRRVGDSTLHFVGKSPPDWLRRASQTDPCIVIHGFVESLESVYRNAGVFVCPITDGGGTKLKILDAMANGVPIVAHPVAVEGINLNPGKDVLTAAGADELAASAVRVLEDDALATRLRRNAYEVVDRNYSSEAVGVRLVDLYMKSIGKSAAAAERS